MKNLMTTTLIALAMAAAPALAQTTTQATPPVKSQADCQASWKAADKNSDGKLDASEISAAKSMVPTTLTGKTSIMQQEFLSACGDKVQGAGAKK